jgi:hypothetical protein
MMKKLKKSIQKFLDDMAKENQQTFGTQKMDCCNLNKITNQNKK